MRRFFGAAVLAAATLWYAVIPAAAQSYPTRPISLIVPAAAGGPTDAVSRLIAEAMTPRLGPPVPLANNRRGRRPPQRAPGQRHEAPHPPLWVERRGAQPLPPPRGPQAGL